MSLAGACFWVGAVDVSVAFQPNKKVGHDPDWLRLNRKTRRQLHPHLLRVAALLDAVEALVVRIQQHLCVLLPAGEAHAGGSKVLALPLGRCR